VAAAELGELNLRQRSPAFLQSVREREQRLQKWLPIKTNAGQDTTVDASLVGGVCPSFGCAVKSEVDLQAA
jgi:hypothetical protein